MEEPAGENDLAKLDGWVAEGLISAEQAEAIRAHEARRPEPPAPAGGVSLATEALGYLGGGLAVIAAVILAAELWPDLALWAKVLFAAVITLVLAGAGALIRASDEPAIRRLSSFLWFLSSAGVAFVFGVIADEVFEASPQSVALAAALSAGAYSLLLWLVTRTHLQQLALFAAVQAASVSLLLVLDDNIDPFFVGLLVMGLGLVWGLLGWAAVMVPSITALVLSAVALLVGAQIASSDSLRGWGLLLGLVAAVGLLAAGVLLRRTVLLGLGALGVIVFVPQSVNHLFGETLGAAVVLLLTGLLLVIGTVAVARLRGRAAATKASGS
ncbi:MAG: DUF2157 domain-containing protein [Acidimicrobiia bacterium]